jgi:uncharacterized protein (TIGR03545 family)/uncharacterized protein (TIGR03546 family)
MNFLKFLKTLNSAQASWQISLAIVLGMISGFLPLATPINFFLLFIAFAINIPLGVFLFISASFSLLGYLLDPLFASIGLSVLTDSATQTLFTSMYNYAPTLWTSFNYTTLMGSLLISFPLALILFPILSKVINKQRGFLEAKFKESKYFSWLNPYTEDKLKEKPGLMRWWAAGLFVGVVGAIVALALLVLDPLLKTALEYSLSKATKKEVHIQSLSSTLADTSLEIKNISILSNSNNAGDDIKIDKVRLQLNTTRLLEKKFDFKIISFGNITLHTTLKRDKEERVQSSSKKSDAEKKSSFNLPQFPDPKTLLAKEGLKSVSEAKKMKEDINKISKKWEERLKGEKQKAKLASLKSEFNTLKKNAKNIHSMSDIKTVLKEADRLKKETKELNNELKSYKKEYAQDKKLINKYLKEMKTLPKEDYNHLLKKYSLDQNGAMNLLGTYFSSSVEKYLRAGLEYYDYIKPYISSDEEKEPEQKRLNGKWVYYTNTTPFPKFVIQKLHANVIKEQKNFKLDVKDISNNQKIYGKPIKGTLTSKSKEYKKILVSFEHNELKKDALTTINTDINAYKVKDKELAKKLSLKSSLVDLTSHVSIENFTTLESDLLINFNKSILIYAPIKSKTDKIIQDILAKISQFKIDAWIAGTLKEPKISLSTDLDNKLKKGINKQLKQEVKKYKKKLQLAINKTFKKQLGDIDLGEFNDVQKIIDSSINDSSSLKKKIKQSISKDALEKQLKSDTAKKLEDKLKKSLKFF